MTVSITFSVRSRVLVRPRWWFPVSVIVMEGGLAVFAWVVPVGVERGLDGYTVRVEQRDASILLPPRLARWLLGPA